MRHLTRLISCCCVAMVPALAPPALRAQHEPFGGGSGDGAAAATAPMTAVTGEDLSAVFAGGGEDGADAGSASSVLAAPGLIDADGDGMPDDYELANGLDPSLDDAALDLDGDGSSNLAECRFGTDPDDPTDRIRLVISSGVPGSGVLNFVWPSVAGRTYLLYSSTDLEGWMLEESIPSFGDDLTSFIYLGDRRPRRFFLLHVKH